MSQVEQLIRKALSTTSDDEAVACLKQARKRYNGQTVDVDPTQDAGYEQLARKYHGIAYRNQQAVQMLRRELDYMNDTVIRWMTMHREATDRVRSVERNLKKEKTQNSFLKLAIAAMVPFLLVFIII
jgi:ribosomal protein S6